MTIRNMIANYKKRRKNQINCKGKKYELNKRRGSIGKQAETKKDLKQCERKQNRKNMVEEEDINLGRFFE